MYSLPLLEKAIDQAEPVYGNTVHFEVADLVSHGIATTAEIASWVAAGRYFAWLEGASEPVVKNIYRGRLRQLVRLDGRHFTQLFVNRDALERIRNSQRIS